MPWTIERHDQDDGSITYEIWDYNPKDYERICTINDRYDNARAKKHADRIASLHNADEIVKFQQTISEIAREGKTAPPPDKFDPEMFRYGRVPGDNKTGIEVCSTCGKPPTKTGRISFPLAFLFRDKLSAEEYYISGSCQACQDILFTPASDSTSSPKQSLKPVKCGHCKFWSERIAQSVGGRPLEALCLSEQSPHRLKYQPSSGSCDFGEGGPPIDLNCKYPHDWSQS
jgi:hypothetical protein